jgi:Asp-tRNA(Asn)/Glu-tRNA(Gln) amidotransferase A subunit family amidase
MAIPRFSNLRHSQHNYVHTSATLEPNGRLRHNPFRDPEIADDCESEMLATGCANLTGHPSIALPCGYAGNHPVSLQLTG